MAQRASVVAEQRLADLAAANRVAPIVGSLEAEGRGLQHRPHLRRGRLPLSAPEGAPSVPGRRPIRHPGPDAPEVYDPAGMRVGVLICYDLRFPEAARICALEGADLIALPTNWPVGVQFHPGSSPARAAENHVYLLACDRVGEERGTTFIGRSILLDTNGRALVIASDTEEETILGEVDWELARQTHHRRSRRARVGHHRRPASGPVRARWSRLVTVSIRPARTCTPGTPTSATMPATRPCTWNAPPRHLVRFGASVPRARMGGMIGGHGGSGSAATTGSGGRGPGGRPATRRAAGDGDVRARRRHCS